MNNRPDNQILADRFGRQISYLRVSITDRCNFRCVYCMPMEGLNWVPQTEILSFEEVVTIAAVFAKNGVNRIRLTGGEPLVRAKMYKLVSELKEIEGIEEVVLTTNAFLLPKYADPLKAAGLDGLNISLDTLDAGRFSKITRVGTLDSVLRGIDAALDAGFTRLKFNSVVVGGFNDDEIVPLVEFASEREAIMRFIEFMPIGDRTIWGGGKCVPAKEIRGRLEERGTLTPLPKKLGAGPARYWTLDGPGLPSEGAVVGIISAVTECFCDGCNRVRMTAQGGLRACLADDAEVSLRDIVRMPVPEEEREELLEAAIRRSLFGKREEHRFDIAGPGVTSKLMHAIGG